MSAARWLVPSLVGVGAIALAARSGSRGSANTALAQLREALHATRAPSGSADQTTPRRRPKATDALTAVADAFLRVDVRETSDTDLVAVLLAGTTKDDPLDAAGKLLQDVGGNLARVARAEGFVDRPGFGPMARARVLASAELARRAQLKGAVEGAGQPIRDAGGAAALARAYASGPQERVVGLYFDSQLRLLASRTLHVGAVDQSLIDPREVLLPAVETRAKSIILVHNHPSGGSDPSAADDTTTRRVSEAAKILGYRLIDHFVLGREGESFSYAMQRPHLLSS